MDTCETCGNCLHFHPYKVADLSIPEMDMPESCSTMVDWMQFNHWLTTRHTLERAKRSGLCRRFPTEVVKERTGHCGEHQPKPNNA